jgi:hypothetical protein
MIREGGGVKGGAWKAEDEGYQLKANTGLG